MSEKIILISKDNMILKNLGSGWSMVHKDTENINDVIDSQFGQFNGLFFITNNKIVKWSTLVPAKKIYVKTRDDSGNESDLSDCSVVNLDLSSIKEFSPTSRILDIDEYGNILYSYDSPEDNIFYGGDLIDAEVGIYESEVFNGTNDLVSWRTITWQGFTPDNTSIQLQIRYGDSPDTIRNEVWSDYLEKNNQGFVPIDFVRKQFIQFRAILRSKAKDISPTLTSVTIQNLTSRATHFFTTNFMLPSRVKSGLLTENSITPVSADIVWGINTKNSIDFSDYQIIEPNRLFTTDANQFGENLRVGIKLITPGMSTAVSEDPYNAATHLCNVRFDFTNTDIVPKNFDFRIRFYNDVNRTQLVHTFFSGNDQTGWTYSNSIDFPGTGVPVTNNESVSITFSPEGVVNSQQVFYLVVDAFDGSSFEAASDNTSYVCSTCDEYDPYCSLPVVKNFAIVFTLENGEQVQLNI